jgi:rhodanese-related sulfurtransferase
MKKMLFCAMLSLSVLACGGSSQGAENPSTSATAEISVDELATMMEARTVTVVDANNQETRQKFGVIPGAVILSSYETYDVSELPADKTTALVFYCANTQCSASHTAAAKATAAGYSNVKVLPVGVQGWKDAGRELQTFQQ